MAGQDSSYYPRRGDYQLLGLHQVMTDKNRQMLRQVLLWATPRRKPGQLFSDYLLTTKGMQKNELPKIFNKGQLYKICNDPEMNSFDVTLIYQCLKCGTDGLAPPTDDKWGKQMDTLEGRLTAAKNYRNDFVHGDYVIDDQLYLAKIEEIRNLLTDIINKASHRFGKDQNEVAPLLRDFNEDLNKIRDLPFNMSASSLIYDKLCTFLKIKGRIELEEKYKSESSIIPASNLLGKSKVKVKKIFTKIEIHTVSSQKLVPVDRLFVYVESLSSNKNVLLVEGVAGTGKTTLARLILYEWAKRSTEMENLANYDLAILTECRDGGTPSLAQLLSSLMPIATRHIQGDAQVVKCIQNNELLFVVDGLDELNASSERVFREILALKNTNIITVICTTRPNKVPDIKRYVPDTFKIQHVKIIGIAEDDREDFVINYIQALESHLGPIDTSGLLHYLKRKESCLQEHLRLPFNLILVTMLWLQDPNIVNEMITATELFVKTVQFCKERLIQRLCDNEATSRLSSNDIREKLTLFVKVMTNVAFASHCNDETVLSDTSVKSLRDACKSLSLPHEEVLGTFLVQTTSLISQKLEKISFPHKGLQDFFCALHIEEALYHDDTNLDIPRIMSSVQKVLLEENVPKARIPSLLQEYSGKFEGKTSNSRSTVRSVFREALRGVTITNPDQAVQVESCKQRNISFRIKRFFKRTGQLPTDQKPVIQGLECDLRKWRNILVHLTGLLHHRGRSLTNERAEEMVKLLEESGITNSDEWFDFLSNVKCDSTFSKHIVLRGDIEVTDARVETFLKVLDQAEPNRVTIHIEGDPSATSGLEELLVALPKKNWKMWLSLHHDFRFPQEGSSALDGTLRNLFRSNLKLKGFKGQLSASALKELPSGVFDLRLSITDGVHFQSVLPVLSSTEKRLRRLCIHVPVDIDQSALWPLPLAEHLELFVSDVGEAMAEKASAVARTLLPLDNSYSELYFPGVLRSPTACKRLLEALGSWGVQVTNRVYVSPRLERRGKWRLMELARSKLGSGFIVATEDGIWNTNYGW